MKLKLTLKRLSPLLISTSPPLLPLLHSPLPFVLLLLSFTLMLFCPVHSRLLCGPSVSQPPLNAIFIQATVFSSLNRLSLHNDKNFYTFHLFLIKFNWNLLYYYLRNWMHPLYMHFLIAFSLFLCANLMLRFYHILLILLGSFCIFFFFVGFFSTFDRSRKLILILRNFPLFRFFLTLCASSSCISTDASNALIVFDWFINE